MSSDKTPSQHNSINSSLQCLNELLHFFFYFVNFGNKYVSHRRVLTSSIFSIAHLKVNASVEFPGDQSIGHDHHQPWDCKQHQQQQDVPEGDAR